MKRPTEQTERWMEVEALCRCAQMERDYGVAFGEHLNRLEDDELMLAQMRRLCRRRARWAGLRAVTCWFRQGVRALIKRIGSALHIESPRDGAVEWHGSRSAVSGKQIDYQRDQEPIVA